MQVSTAIESRPLITLQLQRIILLPIMNHEPNNSTCQTYVRVVYRCFHHLAIKTTPFASVQFQDTCLKRRRKLNKDAWLTQKVQKHRESL